MMECYTFGQEEIRIQAATVLGSSPRVTCRFVGEWLSLVEHLVRDQGVGGSNPLSPTNTFIVRSGDMGNRTFRRHFWPEGVLQGLQGFFLQINIAEIVIHKTDQPDAVVNFFDPDGLSDKGNAEVELKQAMRRGERDTVVGADCQGQTAFVNRRSKPGKALPLTGRRFSHRRIRRDVLHRDSVCLDVTSAQGQHLADARQREGYQL
jgi:hypothetical protein